MKGNIQREAHLDENLENTALFEPRIENEEGTGIRVCTYLYRLRNPKTNTPKQPEREKGKGRREKARKLHTETTRNHSRQKRPNEETIRELTRGLNQFEIWNEWYA